MIDFDLKNKREGFKDESFKKECLKSINYIIFIRLVVIFFEKRC